MHAFVDEFSATPDNLPTFYKRIQLKIIPD